MNTKRSYKNKDPKDRHSLARRHGRPNSNLCMMLYQMKVEIWGEKSRWSSVPVRNQQSRKLLISDWTEAVRELSGTSRSACLACSDRNLMLRNWLTNPKPPKKDIFQGFIYLCAKNGSYLRLSNRLECSFQLDNLWNRQIRWLAYKLGWWA